MSVVQDRTLQLKAKVFRGFADPARLAIIDVLRTGPKTVSEVVQGTGLSQPNTSAHLACLKDCGLVCSEPAGRWVRYSLAHPRLEDILQLVEGVLSDVAAQVYACTRYQGEEVDHAATR